MSSFIPDCSIAMAWLFEDEANADTDNLLAELQDGEAFVPNLWHLELGNALIQAEKRGRITAAQITAMLEIASNLPITTDTETSSRALKETISLAQTESLTTYDAAYLELALRRRIPLATRDRQLIRAARKRAVKTLPI